MAHVHLHPVNVNSPSYSAETILNKHKKENGYKASAWSYKQILYTSIGNQWTSHPVFDTFQGQSNHPVIRSWTSREAKRKRFWLYSTRWNAEAFELPNQPGISTETVSDIPLQSTSSKWFEFWSISICFFAFFNTVIPYLLKREPPPSLHQLPCFHQRHGAEVLQFSSCLCLSRAEFRPSMARIPVNGVAEHSRGCACLLRYKYMYIYIL